MFKQREAVKEENKIPPSPVQNIICWFSS